MNRILFDKYEVIRLIGTGRTGKVYLVKDLHLNQLAAVKESTEEFLLAETELLKELEHPGLPRIYDCFRQQEKSFLVMEYIEGMTLRQYLDKHGKVPEEQAVKWAVDLCGILGYLHRHHPPVIYRDLKPENIMIRQNGELKLIDLGGALKFAWGRGKEALCAGTPGYCPIEQWKERQGNVTFDVYGLGAVLHEMLTGARPGMPPCERRALAVYDRTLPGTLDDIVKICTAEDAEDRYQGMEQVENALLHYPGKERRGLLWRIVKRTMLALCGGYTTFCFICPLLKGVPENQIPFPYLIRPFLFLAFTVFLYLILFTKKNKKKFSEKQEKNIWLTEKKFSGLFLLLLLLFETALIKEDSFFPVPLVYAGEEETLWVEMRDDKGRKMLLKNDAVYITNERVRFELPADRLPGEELSMQIVAVGEGGNRYSSRVFLIRAEGGE